jgi:Fe-S-cluster containining protein
MSVEMELGQTRLELKFQVPGGPLRPVRLLPLLRTVSDHLAKDAARRAAAHGEEVSCRAGCAACCRYLVPVSPVEARRLREIVDAMPAPRRAEVEGRFAALRERLAGAGVLERLRQPETLSPEERNTLGAAYFALDLPCPFLEGERCSIYPERPLACREFMVTSPAELCGATDGTPVRMVRLPGRPSMAATALEDGPALSDGGWVLLSLALGWVAAHPEAEEPPTGPELVGRFFDALARTVEPPPEAAAEP